MKVSANISKIMSEDVVTIDARDQIIEAKIFFRNHHIRHAPVLLDGELIGMISEIDLQRLSYLELEEASGFVDSPLTVRQIMTPDPVSIQQSASIKDAAEILSENEFHALPVLHNDSVVGIVSTTDLIKYLMEHI